MAATMSVKLKQLNTLKRDEGREVLREELGWPPFDEEDYPQRSICLDCLFDNLMFMINKGFQWNEISVLFSLYQCLLQDCKGCSVNDVIKYFTNRLHSVRDYISDQTAKCYSEFFFTTYMRHVKLYQYVLNEPQQKLCIDTNVSVSTPPVPVPPFTEAKDLDVYDYEKQYAELDQKEETKLQQHQKLKEETKTQGEEQIKKCMESVDESPISREDLIKLIHDVANVHITAASNAILTDINNTMEDLDIMLEKTALPRPNALGPPPRYKTKTPIPSSPSKRAVASRETVKSKSRQSSRQGKK